MSIPSPTKEENKMKQVLNGSKGLIANAKNSVLGDTQSTLQPSDIQQFELLCKSRLPKNVSSSLSDL